MPRAPITPPAFRFAIASTLIASSAVLAGGCTSAQADEQATAPAAAAPTPAPEVPAVERLLDQLEAAAAGHRTLTARVRMRSIQDLLDDETVRFGDLAWARADDTAGTRTRFAVAFDRLKTLDGPLEAVDRRYVYDGRWLLDLDGQAQTATRRELEAPDRAGPSENLALGDGPFLIPVNLKKERVLARFEASLASPDVASDPPGDATDHLVLTPRETPSAETARLDLWFDRDSRLPRRVVRHQADGDRTVVDLFEIILNPPLPVDRFTTALPRKPGWELQTVPLATTQEPSASESR